MIYTLKEGVDDSSERIKSYLFRGLPIVLASMIAIVGAFSQMDNGSDANNQQPLAIYTEAASDFGNPANPQGNSNDKSSSGGTATTTPSSTSVPQTQPRLSTSDTSTSSLPPTSSLPVGGMGGGGDDSSGCLCQQLQETVNAQVTTVTGTLPPVPPVLP